MTRMKVLSQYIVRYFTSWLEESIPRRRKEKKARKNSRWDTMKMPRIENSQISDMIQFVSDSQEEGDNESNMIEFVKDSEST